MNVRDFFGQPGLDTGADIAVFVGFSRCCLLDKLAELLGEFDQVVAGHAHDATTHWEGIIEESGMRSRSATALMTMLSIPTACAAGAPIYRRSSTYPFATSPTAPAINVAISPAGYYCSQLEGRFANLRRWLKSAASYSFVLYDVHDRALIDTTLERLDAY
jgi:hypothetical protein